VTAPLDASATQFDYSETPGPDRRDELFDRFEALERRLDSFMTEARETLKDLMTTIRVHHGRGLDTEERVTAVETDIVAITAALPKRKKRK